MVLNGDTVCQRIAASASSQAHADAYELNFQAMGTRCRVWIRAQPSVARGFAAEVLGWVAEFEATYSRFLPESLITRINAAAGREWVEVDPSTERLFALCDELHFLSGGVFDPTALPVIQLWDWRRGEVPSDAAVSAALRKVGWRKVERRSGAIFLPETGMSLDLGGIGKEYAVDQVTLLADRHGISGVLVDFGQDVRVRGTPPDGRPYWQIGLDDPFSPGQCWAGVGGTELAVATSGHYIRGFESAGKRYGHIIDPRTGRPADNGCQAVSVIAPNCMIAGAYSTTALILGEDEGMRLMETACQVEGCMTTQTGRRATRRFYEHVLA
jgi:thiamine biosynthesis lipoprotein